MSGFEYFKDAAFNKYAQFEGRASRSEFWYFYLFSMIFFIAIALIMFVFADLLGGSSMGTIGIIFIAILGLAFILPYVSVAVRRLHDGGYSGAYFFISFIPYIGGLIMLYFYVKDSDPGDNQYGHNPKLKDVANIQDNLV